MYTHTKVQVHGKTRYYNADINTNNSLLSVVKHLQHIKNKFIQSQFTECLVMQGRNTI